MNKEQISLLLKLKSFSILNKKSVFIDLLPCYIPFILFLYKENIIQSFFIIKKKIVILLKSSFNNDFLSNIKIIFKPSFSNSLTYKDISKINTKKVLIAFSTDKGLKTLFDCKRLKIGGKPLFLL